MSSNESGFMPPVPTPPYQLPELELGPLCAGCVSIDVCPPMAVRSETADLNKDLVSFQDTPTHDRVVSEIFAYGPAKLERKYDDVQAAINDCLGGVALVHELPQDETGIMYFAPQPLVPTFGVQSVQRGLRPVESPEELRARGFEPVFSETDDRIVRIGVADQLITTPVNIATQQVGNVEAFTILENFRESAKPPTETLPENATALIAEAVHAAVQNVLAHQVFPTRRSQR